MLSGFQGEFWRHCVRPPVWHAVGETDITPQFLAKNVRYWPEVFLPHSCQLLSLQNPHLFVTAEVNTHRALPARPHRRESVLHQKRPVDVVRVLVLWWGMFIYHQSFNMKHVARGFPWQGERERVF